MIAAYMFFDEVWNDRTGPANLEHWGSRWLMLEGARQLVGLLADIQGQSVCHNLGARDGIGIHA